MALLLEKYLYAAFPGCFGPSLKAARTNRFFYTGLHPFVKSFFYFCGTRLKFFPAAMQGL
jgi:hypothetical protein